MINSKIFEITQITNVPVEKILKVAFALHVYDQVPNMLIEYIETGEVTHDEVEHIYRINLFDWDGERYSLKFPLFVENEQSEKSSRFDVFWKQLTGKNNPYGLSTRGHNGNMKTYAPIARTPLTIEIFNKLDEDNQLDIDRACKTIARYYRDTDMCLKLENYFSQLFMTDYENFEEVKVYSKMI